MAPRYPLRHRREPSPPGEALTGKAFVSIECDLPEQRGLSPTKSNAAANLMDLAMPADVAPEVRSQNGTHDPTVDGRHGIVEVISLLTPEPAVRLGNSAHQVSELTPALGASSDTSYQIPVRFKREATSNLESEIVKRIHEDSAPAEDTFMATVNQALGQYRQSDQVEKYMLKGRVTELEMELQKKSKEINHLQGQIREHGYSGRSSGDVFEDCSDFQDQSTEADFETNSQQEEVTRLLLKKGRYRERTRVQENEIHTLKSEVSGLIRDVYEQKKLRKFADDAKDNLRTQLQNANDVSSKEKEALRHKNKNIKQELEIARQGCDDLRAEHAAELVSLNNRHFNLRVQEEACKRKEIDEIDREKTVLLQAKDGQIKSLRRKAEKLKAQLSSAKSNNKHLEKSNQALGQGQETLRNNLFGMFANYDSLYEQNEILWTKLEAVASGASFGGISDAYQKILNDLKGLPLQELKEYSRSKHQKPQ